MKPTYFSVYRCKYIKRTSNPTDVNFTSAKLQASNIAVLNPIQP